MRKMYLFLLAFLIFAGSSYSQNSLSFKKKPATNYVEVKNQISGLENTIRQVNDLWVSWDDGTNFTGIGGVDFNFSAAARWQVGDLSQYNGDRLTKVRVMMADLGFTSVVLKIWTGNNASNLVYEKQLTGLSAGVWKETTIPTTILINSNQELWVGYTIYGPNPNNFPAGVDNGPAVKNRGDMISTDDGVSWSSLATDNSDLDYNWNIQFFVEGNSSAVTADFTASKTNITVGESVTFNNLSSGANQYSWAFQGGSPATSTQQNPTVTYNTEGTFDVSLTATNGSQQDIKMRTNYITVSNSSGPLSVTVSSEPGTELCEGGSTKLTAIAQGGSGNYQFLWTWDLDNTQVTGNVLNITNLFQSTNVYLKVISGSQEENETIYIKISDNPPASVVAKGNPERILICPHPDLEYQWFNSNQQIIGATGQYYYPGEFESLNGTYYVLTTNQSGCYSYSENYTVNQTKDASQNIDEFVKLYPNPAQGKFTMELNSELLLNSISNYNLNIYSASGANVWQTQINNTFNVDVKPNVDLEAGIYIVVLSSDNTVFETSKLIVY